jgi:hypothetical protein
MPDKKYKIKSLIKHGFTHHNELNPMIFDENQKLKKKVRDKLLVIADDFIGSLGVDDIDFEDIVLIGSIVNYNWNPYSDIDLHIVYDFQLIDADQNLVSEFFDAKKNAWAADHDVKIYNYDVELYGQDSNEVPYSTGVYSVLNDEWLIKPKVENYKLYPESLVRKSKYFMKLVDYTLNLTDDPEKQLKLIRKIKDKIKKYRQSGLEENGEYSEENLVFKLLRRMGYLDKMSKFKHKIEDKLMSLPENKK